MPYSFFQNLTYNQLADYIRELDTYQKGGFYPEDGKVRVVLQQHQCIDTGVQLVAFYQNCTTEFSRRVLKLT
jgi:hypothetical protein